MTYPNRILCCSVRMTPEEMDDLDAAWVQAGFANRTQYFRTAVNYYAGRDICKTHFPHVEENYEEKKQDDKTNEFKRV